MLSWERCSSSFPIFQCGYVHSELQQNPKPSAEMTCCATSADTLSFIMRLLLISKPRVNGLVADSGRKLPICLFKDIVVCCQMLLSYLVWLAPCLQSVFYFLTSQLFCSNERFIWIITFMILLHWCEACHLYYAQQN